MVMGSSEHDGHRLHLLERRGDRTAAWLCECGSRGGATVRPGWDPMQTAAIEHDQHARRCAFNAAKRERAKQ